MNSVVGVVVEIVGVGVVAIVLLLVVVKADAKLPDAIAAATARTKYFMDGWMDGWIIIDEWMDG